MFLKKRGLIISLIGITFIIFLLIFVNEFLQKSSSRTKSGGILDDFIIVHIGDSYNLKMRYSEDGNTWNDGEGLDNCNTNLVCSPCITRDVAGLTTTVVWGTKFDPQADPVALSTYPISIISGLGATLLNGYPGILVKIPDPAPAVKPKFYGLSITSCDGNYVLGYLDASTNTFNLYLLDDLKKKIINSMPIIPSDVNDDSVVGTPAIAYDYKSDVGHVVWRSPKINASGVNYLHHTFFQISGNAIKVIRYYNDNNNTSEFDPQIVASDGKFYIVTVGGIWNTYPILHYKGSIDSNDTAALKDLSKPYSDHREAQFDTGITKDKDTRYTRINFRIAKAKSFDPYPGPPQPALRYGYSLLTAWEVWSTKKPDARGYWLKRISWRVITGTGDKPELANTQRLGDWGMANLYPPTMKLNGSFSIASNFKWDQDNKK